MKINSLVSTWSIFQTAHLNQEYIKFYARHLTSIILIFPASMILHIHIRVTLQELGKADSKPI